MRTQIQRHALQMRRLDRNLVKYRERIEVPFGLSLPPEAMRGRPEAETARSVVTQ